MTANWFVSLLRTLCMFLDWIVYNLVEQIYQLFLIISQTGIFTSENMQGFASRIYFFLGLLMIFKVSISIVQYILNPDSVKDSKVGASKLLKNVIIILLGIVLIPYAFNAAYNLQKIVLKNNIIGNLILGMNDSENPADDVNSAGTTMAFTSFKGFFNLNTNIANTDGSTLISGECSALPVDEDGNLNTTNCNSDEISLLTEFINKDSKNANFTEAYKTKKVYYFGQMDFNYQVGDYYLFDYTILISTLAGGFIAYILLMFCIDVAVRNVKLGFLQLIAPIPLIAKVDPKKGDEVFNKWTKECISTYLDLFIRVAAIYFAIFLISVMMNGTFDIVTGEDTHNIFLDIFFMIGILSFAKDLPKFIETLTGIKMNGSLSLNPMKNKNLAPLGMAGAMIGAKAANVARGVNKAKLRSNGNKGRMLLGGLGGLVTPSIGAGIRAGSGLMSGKGMGEILKAQGDANLKRAKDLDSNIFSSAKSGFESYFGIPSGKDKMINKEKANDLYKKFNGENGYITNLKNSAEYASADNYQKKVMENETKAGMFKSQEFRDAYVNMNNAKAARNMAQSTYDILEKRLASGDTSVTAEAVTEAAITAKTASSTFDNLAKEFDKQKEKFTADAETFETYKYADDVINSTNKLEGYTKSANEIAPQGKVVSEEERMQQFADMVAKAVGGNQSDSSTTVKNTSNEVVLPSNNNNSNNSN